MNNPLAKEQATKVLIVDDEPQIRKFLSISLNAHEYTTLEATNGADAISTTASMNPDLLILDLGLPDIDGISIIKKIREWSNVPIIVLSVRQEENDKIQAMDSGANDYITKPFGVGELMARIRACLRNRSATEPADPAFELGKLKVDLIRRVVTVNGERIKLSPKEYKLLQVLVSNAGRVVSHTQLMQQVWGSTQNDDNQYLRIYIRQLRQKLHAHDEVNHYIHSEPGIGYRLELVD